jgi:CRP-like cAMP-binding protein
MAKNFKPKSCENCDGHHKGIFCGLGKESVNEVSSTKVMNLYKKGQTLFFQGNPSFGIYCISNGKVKLSKITNEGKEIILRIAGAGDVLGHQNLYTHENYSSTATVIEDAEVCFIPKKFAHEMVEKEPIIAQNVIKKLSEDMALVESKNIALSQKNVRERLAELLLYFNGHYGVQEYGRYRLNIILSREELASMVGTANETIIRFISEFKDERIIQQEGKVIYIVDLDKLKKTADPAA